MKKIILLLGVSFFLQACTMDLAGGSETTTTADSGFSFDSPFGSRDGLFTIGDGEFF